MHQYTHEADRIRRRRAIEVPEDIQVTAFSFFLAVLIGEGDALP